MFEVGEVGSDRLKPKVLQIRERKGYSMEDLEEACEASVQRGILRADLFKVFLAGKKFESFLGRWMLC